MWEKYVRKVTPYVPGEQPENNNILKLNTNENPYPPSSYVKKAMEEISDEQLRLYPDPRAGLLVKAIANHYGLKEEQIFPGVGSDDVLAMCFLTFFQSEKPIFFPDITYSFYEVWANLYRIPYEKKPLGEKFQIYPKDYFGENGGIIFPNPNAPTGIFLPLKEVEEIVEKNKDVIVIIDEAYIDFGGQTALPLVEKYDNLLVVHTFSKSRAMAGARIGFAMGDPKLIHYLNDVKFSFNSYTLGISSLIAGAKAMEDNGYFFKTTEKIKNTREWTKRELKKLGFSFPDSMGNFVFASHEKYRAEDIFIHLKENNIYVRHFQQPKVDNYLRITIGTKDQMEKLMDCLDQFIR